MVRIHQGAFQKSSRKKDSRGERHSSSMLTAAHRGNSAPISAPKGAEWTEADRSQWHANSLG